MQSVDACRRHRAAERLGAGLVVAFDRRWVIAENRLLRTLLGKHFHQVADAPDVLPEAADVLWAHPQLRAELLELFDVLADGISHLTLPLSTLRDVPLQVHARYTRI